MQGSASYPAALGSSKWIASFLARHRYDDGIYARTSTRPSSPQEVKFRDFVKKSKAELKNVFSANEKKKSEEGVDELRNANDTGPERKNKKLSWAKMFDTKSGNKLHKRAKSAPGDIHVPHQLDPITEVGESRETQVDLVSANTSSRKPVGENHQCSTSRQTDGDDVSVLTTCTTIIQQANLQGVSEGNARDAATNDESIAIGGRNCTSNPATHLSSGNSNNTEDEYPSQEESDNTSDGCEKDVRPEENARQEETARQEENVLQNENPGQEQTNNNDLTSKSSSKFSLRSVLSMFMGSDGSDEEAKAKSDGNRKLKRKGRLSPRLRTLLIGKTKSESSTKSHSQSSSQDLSQSDAQLANQIVEQDRTFKGLDWKLPVGQNEMGQLIREFSGDLNTATQEMVHKTPVSPKTPSLQSYPSKFDVSMDQNLLPRPAMAPALYSHDQGHNQQVRNEPTSKDALVAKAVHMENKQAQLVEIKTRSDRTMNQDTGGDANQNQVAQEVGRSGKEPVERDTTNDVHPPRTWQHGGDPAEVETVEEYYAATDDMVSMLQGFEEEELPEDFTPGQPATEALMKELEIERLGGFFTTLQNVRNESPEQLIAARDPRAVVTWRDEIAELTSNGGMIRNDKAEQLYQQAPSTAGSDGALSAMTYKPSRAEVKAALAHPEAPVIQGYSLAKNKYTSQMQPAMSRNEIILDEWDRADAVACIHKHNQQQKLKQQEEESEEAARRRRLKIYRSVERHIVDGRRLAVKINREATAAFQMCEHLDEEYERLRGQILRYAEDCGHEPTDNLQHAVDLIRKTQQEEEITYRKYEGCESADPESPESVVAAHFGRDYHEIAGNHVDKTVDPTNEFF
ncbi:hypothetical protein DER44DRAFT_712540 [Fusarium oxysporum]|nr:hypothetical protein DER44DRAFT_712540 [Fusarium oxysporum]